ncbi:alpha/beta fold hydrolase [Eudoraea adriatica]|uniref:alpha/beta fold hydrolase n=1 Tax=Eudoraea adriatica TaxID=446681 RepID=UPI000367DC72|nr:alpha/beta hydrolase [Eudoraea adriatica]
MGATKIPVYFMPGMAASSGIFKNIELDKERFEMHLLEWFVPEYGITFEAYANQMCMQIKHERPVLIGVSLGGMLVQEMAKLIETKKVIIISSVKQKSELPKRLIFAKYTKIHKLLPTGLVNNVELLVKYAFGVPIKNRLKLYEQYLAVRDKYYIDWCIDKIVHWNQSSYDPNLIHIHGDNDVVFPIQYIKDCHIVPKGTHTMIIHRYKWFNERLPTIILE